MTVEISPRLEPATRAAIDDLQRMIQSRYPTASFAVARGEDPEGFYLKATVDLADVDEIVDQKLLDRLYELQVEHELPVYVLPLQPTERVLAALKKRPARSLPPRLPEAQEPLVTPPKVSPG